MWRRQALAACISQRDGPFSRAVAPAVVAAVVVLVLGWLLLEPAAAAAAVAMPANASSSPQARMERRNV
jgi:hypothetical protein